MAEKKACKTSVDEFLGKVLCSQEFAVKDAKARYSVINKHPGVLFALLNKLEPYLFIRQFEADIVGEVGALRKDDQTEFDDILRNMAQRTSKKSSPKRFELLLVHLNQRERDGTLEKRYKQAILFNPFVGKYESLIFQQSIFSREIDISYKAAPDTSDNFYYAWIGLFLMVRLACPYQINDDVFDEDKYSLEDFKVMVNNFMCYMLTEAEGLHVFEMDRWLLEARERDRPEVEDVESLLAQGEYPFAYSSYFT